MVQVNKSRRMVIIISALLVSCISQVGFKTFLGIVPIVANWNQKGDEFSLILDQNPLTEFVELPEDHPQLLYSNIVCGVIRGALEMVSQDIYHTQTSSQLSV